MSEGSPQPLDQALLDFFHVCPVGLISFGDDGEVRLLNPAAVSLLAPALGTASMDNLFHMFGDFWSQLRELVAARHGAGRIADAHRIRFGTQPPCHLAFTAVRIGPDDNMLVVADVTAQVAAEEQRMHLLELERLARERTELLERTATHLAAAKTVDELADAVIGDLTKALGTEIVALNVREGESIRVMASEAIRESGRRLSPAGLALYERAALDWRLPGPEVIATGAPIRLDSADEIDREFPAVLTSLPDNPVESLLALPLRSAAAEVIGSLVVASSDPELFGPEVASLLGGVADQVGLALERARLFDQVLAAQMREHEIARQLQRALLPERLIEHPSFEIAANYHAAGKDLVVGGDWYDTFVWPGGQVGLVVGDVAGHDLDSTVTMGRLRASLAALAPVIGPSPAGLLEGLDASADQHQGVVFATVACVVVDPAEKALRYASAGHPPPMLVDRAGRVTRLDEATTPPIGFRGAVRREAGRSIDATGTLLLYSDGLIERREEEIGIGLRRLEDFLAASGGLAPDALVDDVVAALIDGTVPADDLVVLAARMS